jgi:hypothetical protein
MKYYIKLLRWFFPRQSMLAAVKQALRVNHNAYDALDDVETAILSCAHISPQMARFMGPLWDILYSDRFPEFKVRQMRTLVGLRKPIHQLVGSN